MFRTSCADVQEEATRQGAEKPRRQACSIGRRAASPGLGGTPTSGRGYPKGYPRSLLAQIMGMFRGGSLVGSESANGCNHNFLEQDNSVAFVSMQYYNMLAKLLEESDSTSFLCLR